jgi:hypothetical protein
LGLREEFRVTFIFKKNLTKFFAYILIYTQLITVYRVNLSFYNFKINDNLGLFKKPPTFDPVNLAPLGSLVKAFSFGSFGQRL